MLSPIRLASIPQRCIGTHIRQVCLRSAKRSYASVNKHNGTAGKANNDYFRISEEVRDALHTNKPVVALETAIYTHGFPKPDNLTLAQEVEKTIRDHGAIPATIGIMNGQAVIGLSSQEMEELAAAAGQSNCSKCSRRDVAFLITKASSSGKYYGGTTIAGTMLLAHLANIKVFATGGLGGVHKGAETTMDVSADLNELGRTPVAVISSGMKSFLDFPKTLEYLETQGVFVSTFGEGNEMVDIPAFFARDSGYPSPNVVQTPEDAAKLIYVNQDLNINSGQLFFNPIPNENEIPKSTMDDIIAAAVDSAKAIIGKDNTPFVLNQIKERTKGASLPANRALVLNNAMMGAKVAVALSNIHKEHRKNPAIPTNEMISNAAVLPEAEDGIQSKTMDKVASSSNIVTDGPSAKILVVGGIAVDVGCNIKVSSNKNTQTFLGTSNPSQITTHMGGVARNIATSVHNLGGDVKLMSLVGDDLFGQTVLEQLKHNGMDLSGIRQVVGGKTACYVSINSPDKDMIIASADMDIIEGMSVRDIFKTWPHTEADIICFDGNIDPLMPHFSWSLRERKGKQEVLVAFEPTSVQKSKKIFSIPRLYSLPAPLIDIITPNADELFAMADELERELLKENRKRDVSYYSHIKEKICQVLDARYLEGNITQIPQGLSNDSQFRAKLKAAVKATSTLLPIIPTIFTKFGAQGVLVSKVLYDKPDPKSATAALDIHGEPRNHPVRDVLLAFYPAQKVPQKWIKSVNGVGDTFMASLLVQYAKNPKLSDLETSKEELLREFEIVVNEAQARARDCLKSDESAWIG